MSTDYSFLPPIPFCALFDGRLQKFGILEHIKRGENREDARWLTDGNNYLQVHRGEQNEVGRITRHGANAPGNILRSIAEMFDVDIFSEYEPQYWGFETEEEWNAALEEMAQRERDEFYKELMKYIRDEPNSIVPGRIGELMAKIAKELVAESPELGEITHKCELLEQIDRIYEERHAVRVELTPEDIEFVKLLATHEEDLPKA